MTTNPTEAVTYIQLQSQPAAASGLTAAMQQGMMAQPLSSTPTCVQPGSGLVSWWRGEGNTLDYMGNNPGTPENGVGAGQGEVGEAFSFNGYNQWVEIPYAANLATPSFTLEGWIYPASNLSGQVFIYGQSYGRQFDLEPAGSVCFVAIYITDVNGHFKGLYSNAPIPVGGWSHVAATWDGTTLKLYINGALNAQSTPGLSAIGDSHCSFSIGGAGSCSPGQYFPGLIDEMSVYDRALFAGEIQAIYNAGSAGKCTGPPPCVVCPASALSWWPAEGDASDLFHANGGTLQNGTGLWSGHGWSGLYSGRGKPGGPDPLFLQSTMVPPTSRLRRGYIPPTR